MQVLKTLVLAVGGWLAVTQVAAADAAKPIVPECETPVVTKKEGYKKQGQADDIAIWVNQADKTKSRVIAAVKGAGIYVYDLNCKKVQDNLNPKKDDKLGMEYINNLDLRYGVRYGDEVVDLVVGADEDAKKLFFFKVTTKGVVEPLPAPRYLKPAFGLKEPKIVTHGLCMYKSPLGEVHVLSTQEGPGEFAQYRLGNDEDGRPTAQLVRNIRFGDGAANYTEACVFDDEHGYLYIAQEGVGIWKFSAVPANEKEAEGKVADRGSLIPDSRIGGKILRVSVEGLSIFYGKNGTGYLFANNEGADATAIFDRNAPHSYIASFAGASNSKIDSIQSPDGNDVSNVDLGGAFSEGLFISHDDIDTGGKKGANFKFFSLKKIAEISTKIQTDTSHDPRQGFATEQFSPQTPVVEPVAPPASGDDAEATEGTGSDTGSEDSTGVDNEAVDPGNGTAGSGQAADEVTASPTAGGVYCDLGGAYRQAFAAVQKHLVDLTDGKSDKARRLAGALTKVASADVSPAVVRQWAERLTPSQEDTAIYNGVTLVRAGVGQAQPSGAGSAAQTCAVTYQVRGKGWVDLSYRHYFKVTMTRSLGAESISGLEVEIQR